MPMARYSSENLAAVGSIMAQVRPSDHHRIGHEPDRDAHRMDLNEAHAFWVSLGDPGGLGPWGGQG
jgi:hypothetical protein